ncbi:MAG: DNA repair protein RecN [Rickettsiaceae bacterium]|nr:DNA repair protein RecN [Rickettsiaceae bacterium]
MLQNLHINDFILIEKLELDLTQGFCVITGDTGAGKSILLDSILFCLGGKNFSNPIRPGSDVCSVTLVFSVCNKIEQHLQDLEINVSDEIILKRTQTKDGRKKFFINDQIVTIKIIQSIFDYLLELHGQHNHTTLLNPSSHMEILDEYGKLSSLKSEVALSYQEWQSLESKIAEFAKNKDEIESEIDYLSHVCAELQKANIAVGEEQDLADTKKRLQNRDKEIKIINSILADIESSSIEQVISKSQRSMGSLDIVGSLDKINSDLDLVYDKIEDIKSDLNRNLQELSENHYSSEEIEDRLYEIRTLARKHSCQPDELIEFLQKSEAKLEGYQSQIGDSSSLQEQANLCKEEYFSKAKILSEKRVQAAKNLETKTMQELSTLEMKKAIFKTEVISSESHCSSKGLDRVRFVASTNPGMALAPIDKIASGGELSRFMLSLRVALFDNSSKQVIIFDEIDVGISGSVADSMGQRLKLLSQAVQIIVITHQPQVAGKADQHILVKKTQHNAHTNVEVKSLQVEDKALELARMISGQQITKTGIEAAKELLV